MSKTMTPETDDSPDTDDDKRGSDFVVAVARGMSILECFTSPAAVKQQGRMTLTDAAKLTGLSRGTARRLLLTLKEINYVDFDGKFFWLTPKLVNLSRGFLMPRGLGDGSSAILHKLTEELDESASVGILDGAEIVYIDRAEIRRIYSSRIVNGTRLPAAYTSIGRVLLASLADEELNRWLSAHPLKQLTPNSITERDSFWQEISRIRSQGYAINDEELEIGIRSIAVPIMGANHRITTALNASTVTARHSVDDLKNTFLPALQRAAEKLSQTMGW